MQFYYYLAKTSAFRLCETFKANKNVMVNQRMHLEEGGSLMYYIVKSSNPEICCCIWYKYTPRNFAGT